MKRLIFLIVFCGTFLFTHTISSANPVAVTADVPASQATSYVIWKFFPNQGWPDDPETSNALNFTTTLDTSLGVYFADNWYAIDVYPDTYSNITIQYTETENPNGVLGDGSGLSHRGIATVNKKAWGSGPESTLRKEVFGDINNVTFPASQFSATPGGFMRLYIGLATGNPALNEPGNAVPFTVADASGNYRGTITLTITAP